MERVGMAAIRHVLFQAASMLGQPEKLFPPCFRFQRRQHIAQPLAPLFFGHNRLAALAPQNIQIALRHFVDKTAWLGEHKRALPLAIDSVRER